MDASVAELIQYLNHQRHVVDYTFVSATALFIYDYILTIHLEIKFIWPSPWTYTKVLFLLIRYLAFADAILYVVNQMFIDNSAEMCKVTLPVDVWVMAIQMLLCEAVMCIRTWAVWRRDRVIGIGLAVLMLLYLVSFSFLTNRSVQSLKFEPPPFSRFRGCFYTTPLSHLWEIFVPSTVVPSILLVLMAIRAFHSYRQGFTGQFSKIVYRDGILFYIYFLCIAAAVLAIIFALPADYMTTLIPLEDVLYVVFTTRIILNIRESSNRTTQTELHTDFHDPIEFAISPGHDNHDEDSTDSDWYLSQMNSQGVDGYDMQAP